MNEFESLNLTDLDVEELEQRIELGLLMPDFVGNCTSNDCVTFSGSCGTNSCTSNT